MGNNIITSICHAICEYEYNTHEAPDRILLNNACLSAIQQEVQCYPEQRATLYGIPVGLEYLCNEERPRFWLCQEGTIYD